MTTHHNFPIPFTLDQLRESILHVYVHLLRQAKLMTPAAAWNSTLHPKLDSWNLWNPSADFADIGVIYEEIREGEFAVAMEQQYHFAFHGIQLVGLEAMAYESIHTWVAALVMDLGTSAFIHEWESYDGVELGTHVQRCLHSCELANARLILEGHEEGFSWFAAPHNRDQHKVETYGLSIRQMALLSGMEEMSVRTAASRKGSTQLITQKNDAGRTIVTLENAKAWLISKARYIPITEKWVEIEMDLTKTHFTDPYRFESALRSRCTQLSDKSPGRDFHAEAKDLFAKHGFDPYLTLSRATSANTTLIRELAELLELPADLLALRIEECLLRSALSYVESELQTLSRRAN